jgi:hypothetical protein
VVLGFSGLKERIRDLGVAEFYDVSRLYLEVMGFKSITIVDGTGDGGRDVICDRGDLRIQLSVRKDWEKKINDEAAETLSCGRRHFMYVTNRSISEDKKQKFLSSGYRCKGEVDITICDLNVISSALSSPGNIEAAYEVLGLAYNNKLNATPKEIALSNVLLFSEEARDFRENVIESSVKSIVFEEEGCTESSLLKKLAEIVPGVAIEKQGEKILRRLISKQDLYEEAGVLKLGVECRRWVSAAREDYLQSISNDVDKISKKYNIGEKDANRLIEIALEIAARDGNMDGDKAHEVDLSEFLSEHGLQRKKGEIYKDLSSLAVAKVSEFGKSVDHIFSTSTFDVFRALSRNTDVEVFLDSSVAMPMMFGILFKTKESRYGLGAEVVKELCQAHDFKIKVPDSYLEEMAYHGIKALEYSEEYNLLGDEPRHVLKGSGNAYISHYSYIRDRRRDEEKITFNEFLAHYGLVPGCRPWKVQNRISSILEDVGVEIVNMPRFDRKFRDMLRDEKKSVPPVLIDHDASVCTYFYENNDTGFIFATWDKSLMEVVEGKTRIYADTPARIADFLNMASGKQYEKENSYSLLSALLYCDEKKAVKLAGKIEKIKSHDEIYKINQVGEDVRAKRSEFSHSDDLLQEFISTVEDEYDWR